MRAVVLACSLASCGRFDFDPRAADAEAADPSLLLHFTFEGALTADSAPVPHDATCAGECPTAGPSAHASLGTAAEFAGSSCLRIDIQTLRPQEITLALWVRVDQNGNFVARPFHGETASTNSYELYAQSGIWYTEIAGKGLTRSNVPMGEWHFMASTWDGMTLTQSIDGVREEKVDAGAISYADADAFYIGCDRDNGVEVDHMTGAIDEVRFYDRVLAAEELSDVEAR